MLRIVIPFFLSYLISTPAYPCFTQARLHYKDVMAADIVVQGTIKDVQDFPSVGRRAAYQNFTVIVEKVLAGTAPSIFTAASEYSSIPSRHNIATYIIALTNKKNTKTNNYIDGIHSELEPPTVLSVPCQLVMFEADSIRGRTIAEIFDGSGDPAVKAKAAGSISGSRF